MEQWGPLGIWGSGHSLSHYAKAQIPQIQLELRDKLFQHQESESEAKYVSKLVLDSWWKPSVVFLFSNI